MKKETLVLKVAVAVLMFATVVLCTNRPVIADENLIAPSSKLAGNWEGALKLGEFELKLILRLKSSKQRGLEGTLEMPNSAKKGEVPIEKILLRDDRLELVFSEIPVSYVGTLLGSNEIKGTWTQGRRFNVTFKRISASQASVTYTRPQEPQRPFPYDEMEVTVENVQDNVRLAGTLTLPKGNGPFPCVLLCSGSGPQDRDEAIFGHRPFFVLADHLTRLGVAVLRMDDRGFANSTGDFATATIPDFSRDAIACIDFLESVPKVDKSRIGILGHSMGGLVATMTAANRDDIRFLVLIGAPGLPGDKFSSNQTESIHRANGTSEVEICHAQNLNRGIIEILVSDKNNEDAEKSIRELLDQSRVPGTGSDEDWIATTNSIIQQAVTPNNRFWMRYDVTADLRGLNCPVLAVSGDLDVQVPPDANLLGIATALAEGNNPDFCVRRFAQLNHLLQTSHTGTFAEVTSIEETIAPVALEAIGQWIAQKAMSCARKPNAQ